jgi:hypothetical protein
MMGEGMFLHIAKGSVHKKVDATLNHKGAGGMFDKRDDFLTALEQADDADAYLALLQTRPLMTELLTEAEANYLRDTWYNDEGRQTTLGRGWWPWLQPIYPILKAGLIKAIQAAKTPPRPIDSYWLVGSDQVEVIVTALPGAQQVLRLIVTPPGLAPTQERRNPINIWSIRRSRGWDAGNTTLEEIVEAVFPLPRPPLRGDIVIFQHKE